eukprot:TRINITY_DN3553_c0_g1_i4.p1 TRINITY_DN3553_c0_g1~~TRINITY_DN3553_c0_g1_i4.p1  ORF type:complete len:148 (-),score=10.79 TRINITY_DN3553_c0_g1_i4:162-605(-)
MPSQRSKGTLLLILVLAQCCWSELKARTWELKPLLDELQADTHSSLLNAINTNPVFASTLSLTTTLNTKRAEPQRVPRFAPSLCTDQKTRNFLVEFWDQTHRKRWIRHDHWNETDKPLSMWFGVSCEPVDGIRLDLGNNNLNGTGYV